MLYNKKVFIPFFAFLFSLSSLSVYSNYQKKPFQTIDCIRTILDNQGKPSSKLESLLNLFTIEHDGTLKTIVEQTQKSFLRQAGKERWEVEDAFARNKEKAFPLLNDLGLIKEVKPLHKEYDYILLMGALASRVRLRLAHLAELHKQGIQFNRIVFLGGARPLDPNLESESILLNPDLAKYPVNPTWKRPKILPKTEIEMMKMIYEQMDLPTEFRAIPIDFIDTPMQKNTEGSMRRPNTADTIKHWLINNPKPGTTLTISNQPYIGYQDATMRFLMPANFIIDTVGETANETSIAIYLDSLARWLYQENLRLSK